MKTKFLPKLLLLFVLALFLHSCTADENTPSKTPNASLSASTSLDGEPVIPKPR